MSRYAVFAAALFTAAFLALFAPPVAANQTQPSAPPDLPDVKSGWKLVRISPLEVVAEFKKLTVAVRLGAVAEYESLGDGSRRVLIFSKHLVRGATRTTAEEKDRGNDYGLGRKEKVAPKEDKPVAENIGAVFMEMARDARTGEPVLKSVKSWLQTASGQWVSAGGIFIRAELLSEPVEADNLSNPPVGFVLRMGENRRVIRLNWADILSSGRERKEAAK